MRNAQHASPDDIDITSVWSALKSSFRKLVLTSALAAAATFGILSLVAPKYTSEAQLTVTAKSVADPFKDPKRDGQSSDVTAARMDKEAVNTHVRALGATDVALSVVKELSLGKEKEFNSALGSPDALGSVLRLVGIGAPRSGESEEDRILTAFVKQLEVYAPKESRFIGVRFSSIKPELAAEIANKLVDAYRAKLASQVTSEFETVRADLEPKIESLTKDISAAETEVEQLRGRIGSIRLGADQSGQVSGLRERALTDINTELSKVKASRSEAEVRAKSARELMKSGSADVLPDVQKSPLIQALVQQRVRQERQISELSASLLPGHPRMQQLNADLAGLKKQINSEVGKLVESLEKEAKVYALREDSLQKSLDKLKSQIVTVNSSPEEAQLRQAEANVKSRRAELERLQAQFEAARARHGGAAIPVEVQVIQPARASSVPTSPKKGPYTALVALASLLLGTALVVSKALFVGARSGGTPMPAEPRLETRTPAPRAVAATRIAASVAEPIAPRGPREEPGSPEPVVYGDKVLRMASMPSVALHLVGKAPAEGGFRSLVTGETQSIDPTREAIALCQALAAERRQVVLIDWDLDGNGIAAQLKLPEAPGIADLVAGQASFEDVVHRLPGQETHLIGAGALAALGDREFDTEQLNLVLDALDEAYDHIVVAGTYEAVRLLFEAIQGRFDAGIIVTEPKARANVLSDPPGTLLGYEVTDIEIIRFERAQATSAVQRIVRSSSGKNGGSEAHPA